MFFSLLTFSRAKLASILFLTFFRKKTIEQSSILQNTALATWHIQFKFLEKALPEEIDFGL
jgi:hypothetical protein